MTAALDVARALRGLPGGRLGRPLLVLRATTSTNDTARRLAEAGCPEGLVVVAREQLRGRGRQGRVFVSPPGGLYASVLLRPSLGAAAAPRLTFAAGVACAEALRACAGVRAGIDWPNDIVAASGRKLGGILAESRTGPDGRIEWAILGVGLNLVTDPSALPPPLDSRATSVGAEGGRADAAEILAGLLRHLDAALPLLGDAWPALLERWCSLAVGLEGHPTRFRRDDGTEVSGLTAGIDGEGALRLRVEGGHIDVVLAGERVHGLERRR